MAMRWFNFILVVFIVVLFSCSKEDMAIPKPEEQPEFFSLKDNDGKEYTAFMFADSVIHIKVPHDADLSKLIPIFHFEAEKVFVEDDELISGEKSLDFSDFVNPLKIKIRYSEQFTKEVQINLYDLPVLLLDTPDGQPIESKQERTEGCLISLIDESGEKIDLGTAGVKGRGNSTWRLPKKPYNVKLDEKHSILGMKKSKKWVLLSQPYYDRTQMHNSTAFEMARLTDYKWVPSGEFVELIFNGEHQGLYYLCEKIDVAKNKIDIDEMTPADTSDVALTGGYLIETAFGTPAEDRFQTDYFNTTVDVSNPLFWEINSPDDFSKSQYDYIHGYMNMVERMIVDTLHIADGKYRDYIDIETAINWMLVNETALNSEAKNPSNLFLYKHRGGGQNLLWAALGF